MFFSRWKFFINHGKSLSSKYIFSKFSKCRYSKEFSSIRVFSIIRSFKVVIFEIDAGSSISWSGNPSNAEINIATTYKQRASVAALLNDTTGKYKGRFPVDCKLLITNKLFSPNINFAIDFPSLDATSKSRIANVLSDEAELNLQVFSFLLFRSFVTPQIYNSNGGGVTAGGAAASTGSEMLSNRMSEFLNTYFGNLTGIRDLQVGVNYRAGSQTNQEVDLALSKQFLNKYWTK